MCVSSLHDDEIKNYKMNIDDYDGQADLPASPSQLCYFIREIDGLFLTLHAKKTNHRPLWGTNNARV